MRLCVALVLLLRGLCLSAHGVGVDFETLRHTIETQRLRSVEQVLTTLSPTLRYRYLLVFSSRSLQEASYEAPRVILFDNDARTIITFNGDPAQRGFNALEVMNFDEASGRFEFREITFPSAADASVGVTFSAPNPPRCQSCHGGMPRPIWDSGPLWPGVYGERYGMKLSGRERAGLEAFLARQGSDPRYRLLLGVERWSDPETFRVSSHAQYASTAQEPPNAQFGTLLSVLVGRSLARELEQRPALQAYRYALLGLAEGRCGALADFLPKESWSQMRPAWRTFTHDVARAQTAQTQSRIRRLVDPMRFDGSSRESAAPEVMGLGFLAQQVSDMGPSMWTTALEPGSYDLPPSAVGSLRDALLRSAESNDSELTESSALAAGSDSDRYCAYLQRRSRAGLSNATETEKGRAEALLRRDGNNGTEMAAVVGISPSIAAAHTHLGLLRPGRLLGLCAGCHESGVGPPISFNDPESLARELRTQTATHGTLLGEVLFRLSPAAGVARMPLGITLSDGERAQLQSYFTQLSNSDSRP